MIALLRDTWNSIPIDTAARIANAGGFVVAGCENPHGHGHVVFLLDTPDGIYNRTTVRCFHVGSGAPRIRTIGNVFGSSVDVELFVDKETYSSWRNAAWIPAPPAPAPAVSNSQPFSIDTSLREKRATYTAEQIDRYFEKKGSPLAGIGSAIVNASEKYTINPVYMMAHAALETGWGKSRIYRYRIYRYKNNLFGWSAFDSSPYASSRGFPDRASCIDYVMGRINELYLNENGKYFSKKPCLGDKSYGMNKHYASAPEWGAQIAKISRSIEASVGESA